MLVPTKIRKYLSSWTLNILKIPGKVELHQKEAEEKKKKTCEQRPAQTLDSFPPS